MGQFAIVKLYKLSLSVVYATKCYPPWVTEGSTVILAVHETVIATQAINVIMSAPERQLSLRSNRNIYCQRPEEILKPNHWLTIVEIITPYTISPIWTAVKALWDVTEFD